MSQVRADRRAAGVLTIGGKVHLPTCNCDECIMTVEFFGEMD